MRNNILPLDLCHTGSSKESWSMDETPCFPPVLSPCCSEPALSFAQSRLFAGTEIVLFSWTTAGTPLLLIRLQNQSQFYTFVLSLIVSSSRGSHETTFKENKQTRKIYCSPFPGDLYSDITGYSSLSLSQLFFSPFLGPWPYVTCCRLNLSHSICSPTLLR